MFQFLKINGAIILTILKSTITCPYLWHIFNFVEVVLNLLSGK